VILPLTEYLKQTVFTRNPSVYTYVEEQLELLI